jgi:outer membrane protein assembly factor BamE
MPMPLPFDAHAARPFKASLVLAGSLLAGGCAVMDRVLPSKDELPFVYRVDVQQGNVVTQQMLAQLKPGMEKTKVRHIMGTPVLIDVFHSNRWDYLYTFQDGQGPRQRRQVSLFFDGDRLARVEGDVRPAPGPLVVERKPDVEVAVPEVDRRMIDRVREKVGLGDTSQADKAAQHLLEVEKAERKRAERDAKARARLLGEGSEDAIRAEERARTQANAEAALAEEGRDRVAGADEAGSDEQEEARPGLFRRMMRDMGFGGASDTGRAYRLPEQDL